MKTEHTIFVNKMNENSYKVKGKVLTHSEFEKLQEIMPNAKWLIFADYSKGNKGKTLNFKDLVG